MTKKKIKDGTTITIRNVVNGWILQVVSGQEYAVNNDDTLVFNSMDDLCDAIATIYGEEYESKRPDASIERVKEESPPF